MTNKFEAEILHTAKLFGMTREQAVDFILQSATSERDALQSKIDACHEDKVAISKRDEIQNRINGVRIADMIYWY